MQNMEQANGFENDVSDKTTDLQNQNSESFADKDESFNADASVEKFKNTAELARAYKNLEKEFTRKSQLLKTATEDLKLLKQSGFKNQSAAQNETIAKTQNVVTAMQNNLSDDAEPPYKRADWNDTVNGFINAYPKAKNFIGKISKIICEDENLAKKDSCLMDAYLKVLDIEYKPPQKMLEDDDFIDNYLVGNDKVKNKVLQLYLKSKSKSVLPPLLNENSGGYVVSPLNAPKTIFEAGELVQKLIKDL